MATSTISSKGQITLPLEVRTRLGVDTGDRVEFVFENGQTVVRPVRTGESPFRKWAGALGHFSSEQEINKWVGDMRDDAENDAA